MGDGGGAASVASRVRISMKPSPVLVTLASTPCAVKTSLTACGVTVGSSNLIVHTVPPVKSMANWSPTLPPVTGPSRMKIRPGIVTARESAKNQLRFPMMSNQLILPLCVRHDRAPLPEGRRGRWSDGPGTPRP